MSACYCFVFSSKLYCHYYFYNVAWPRTIRLKPGEEKDREMDKNNKGYCDLAGEGNKTDIITFFEMLI